MSYEAKNIQGEKAFEYFDSGLGPQIVAAALENLTWLEGDEFKSA